MKHRLIGPPAARIALWALAIRDAYVVLLPLTFFGVIATLLLNLPGEAAQAVPEQLFGPGWHDLLSQIVGATHGVFSMGLAISVSQQLSRRIGTLPGAEPLPAQWAGVSGLVNFMLCVVIGDKPLAEALGYGSMITGMVIGIATAELLPYTAGRLSLRLTRGLYDGDILFYHAIRLTLPVIANGLLVLAAAVAWRAAPAPAWERLNALPELANRLGDGVWLISMAATLISQLLWFLGIHGSELSDAYITDWFGAAGAPYDPHQAWWPMLDAFVNLGGSGTTMGLVLALFIAARDGPQRRIAQFSLLPALFNVNELLIFGLPIALNPVYLLPFMLVPLLLTVLAVAAVQSGLVPVLPVDLVWSTPMLLSGYQISGSWIGPVAQLVSLGISTAIYLPFARRAEARRHLREEAAFAAACEAIVDNAAGGRPATARHDTIGVVARGLLEDLRHALGTGAVALAFQPKHDRRGYAVGTEALLRWKHPRHGAISPALTVTLAEQGGLVGALGQWVLDEACERKAQWNALGLGNLTMGVNLSPMQLADSALPQRVQACLAAHGLRPEEIELEITEGQPIPAGPAVDATLRRLVEIGVHLAMDDFGMGYSSLLHMRRFRIHAIKIDGSLTRDVLDNPTSADIIRTICTLGRSQGIEVVAEFVDNAAQRDALAELGCEVFQGYLHSPPLPAAACLAYLIEDQGRRLAGTM